MTTYTKFKAYFYNGFDKPKLIATSPTGLLRNVTISDTYTGDTTPEMRMEVEDFKKGKQDFEDFKTNMETFNIYINPTYVELVDVSRQWFGNDTPLHHFEDFKSVPLKIKDVLNVELYTTDGEPSGETVKDLLTDDQILTKNDYVSELNKVLYEYDLEEIEEYSK